MELRKKKEVVAPKYILEEPNDKTAAGAPRSIIPLTDAQALVDPSTTYSANGKQLRLPAWFDFKDGYSLVPMRKKDKNGLVKAQIINKNGKEILSGGPYTYHTYGRGIDSVSRINPHDMNYYGEYDESSWYPSNENANGDAYGAISNDGNILVKKNGKWGVVRIRDGKKIAPFIYDSIMGHYEESIVNTTWGLVKNANTRVSSKGKWGLINTKGVEILPCKYAEIRIGYKYVVVTDAAGKVGYFSTATNKFVMPVQEGLPGDDKEFVALGAVRDDNGRLLKKDGTIVDAKAGNPGWAYPGLFETYTEIDSQLKEGYDYACIGPEGKFVLPSPKDWSGISSYTIVVGDGKIGYINCIFLDWVGKSKSPEIQAQLADIQAKKDAEKIKVSVTYNVVQNPTKLTYKYGLVNPVGMEIKDWCISSAIEIKNEVYEINSKFDFQKQTKSISKKMIDTCNIFLDNLQSVKSNGIIYKSNGDWEDIVFSMAMKKFRKQFKDSIDCLSNIYGITFNKRIPDEY